MAAAADREGAVREVAQVYEMIKTHQPLLLPLAPHADAGDHKLAHTLLEEALRALNLALSVMAAAPEPPPAPPSSASPAASSAAAQCKQASMARRAAAAKRRRIDEEEKSWVNVTTVPHEDGYQWRKYGEKAIHGTPFPRSYYRCTYKGDKGCMATKQIQQKHSSDPPMFQVTYTNDHTCTPPAPAAAGDLAAGTLHPAAAGHDASCTIVKQEPHAAMAPTAAPCGQDSFLLPLGGCTYSGSGFGPCDGAPSAVGAASGWSGGAYAAGAASCDKPEPELGQTAPAPAAIMEQEAAAMMEQEDLDPYFCDPYLLLLYDSFMDQ